MTIDGFDAAARGRKSARSPRVCTSSVNGTAGAGVERGASRRGSLAWRGGATVLFDNRIIDLGVNTCAKPAQVGVGTRSRASSCQRTRQDAASTDVSVGGQAGPGAAQTFSLRGLAGGGASASFSAGDERRRFPLVILPR